MWPFLELQVLFYKLDQAKYVITLEGPSLIISILSSLVTLNGDMSIKVTGS